ncbi:hypothetical protein ACXIHB_00745 [Tenacibaculum sp. IMCC1]|uniref:Uncharacterized protein n=1 Tax=Tenacibaculum sp. Pbs-1 TaxID=3238748 RepID=A0AB33KRG1_9FLAO
MKVKVLLTIVSLITLSISAQNKPLGKVFLRNGKVHSNGYEWIDNGMAKSPQIKYKTNEGLQFIHDSKEIEKVRNYSVNSKGIKDSTDYFYKFYKTQFKLIRKVTTSGGKLELFAEDFINMYPTKPFSKTYGSTQVYYLGKTQRPKIVKLPRRKTSKKFKKVLSEYTSKCKAFTEKINNKNFLKENPVNKIVSYYNENCK